MTLAPHKQGAFTLMKQRLDGEVNQIDTAILGETSNKSKPGDKELLSALKDVKLHLEHARAIAGYIAKLP